MTTTALEGIRVLDFTRILAGPFCTMTLGDLGAEVIKIEQPGTGDGTRQWGPPWVGDPQDQYSAYFANVNRNKRSLTLNLKHPGSKAIVEGLAAQSHVLVENFKVGQMDRYGLGYDALRRTNPGLIYCAISGYGQNSPYRDWPGYDAVIQAMSGLMDITGTPDGPPTKVGVAISDVLTGLNAATAILAALRHREATGEGQFIDIALLDSQIAALVNIASAYLVSGETPRRMGSAHPQIVPYQPFDTADGALMLAVGNDRQFRRLCQIIEQPELADHPDFATNPQRVAHRDRLIPALERAFRQKTSQVWIEQLVEAGIPAGPINSVGEILESDHVQQRGLIHEEDGLRTVGPPAKLTATPPSVERMPPALGQHTDEILRDVLQMDDEAIARCHAEGVV